MSLSLNMYKLSTNPISLVYDIMFLYILFVIVALHENRISVTDVYHVNKKLKKKTKKKKNQIWCQ